MNVIHIHIQRNPQVQKRICKRGCIIAAVYSNDDILSVLYLRPERADGMDDVMPPFAALSSSAPVFEKFQVLTRTPVGTSFYSSAHSHSSCAATIFWHVEAPLDMSQPEA